MVLWVSVEAAPRGGPTDAQSPQTLGRPAQALPISLHRGRVGAEFLAQADGYGVLEVGASRFDDPIELLGLGA